MIGRVLAFAVCVVVVVTEDCNTGADDACCLGTDYGSQLSGLGGTSLPVPTLVEAKSGFRDSVFRMTVELPVQYHTAHSGEASATVLDEEFSDMPNVMIGCMSAVCPTDITGTEEIGTVDTTNCVFEIQTDFAFGDISSSLVSTPYNTDVQTEADNEASAGTATYKYGAIEVQAAVNVFGETYQADYSTRVVVDTMLYRLKFKTTVSVTTQTTVVYAAVQVSLGMFLTRVRVPDLGDYSVFSDLNGETCDTENTDVGSGADYCATLVTTRITVGVSTLVVNPYVTTLRTDTDNFAFAWAAGSKPAFTPHPGFEIRDLDRNSGLRWIPGSGPRTIRRNNLNAEASTTATEVLDGTPGLFHTSSGSNCGEDTGICRQDYFLYMEYRSSKGDPEYFYNNVLDTGLNAGRNGDIDTYANDAPSVNTASNECQISGAEVNIGHGAQYNNANGLGDVGYAELKCRSDISYTRAVDDPVVVSLSDDVYPLTGGTFDPADFDGATVFAGDGACIFDPNGEDVEDDITFQITLSTADWCPSVSIQNQLAQAMTVDGATKMAGGPLVLNVHVRPAPGAAPSANSNTLPVTQLKIMTLQAQCDPAQDYPESCNIIADGYDGTDTGEVMSMINTGDDNWRDVGLDYSENGEGCIIDDDKVDDDHPNSAGWCTIPAEVMLCEYTDVVDEPQATPGCYDGPGENREAAFDIDDAYTYTDVRFSATVQVAYEGVPFAKKAVNVEFSPHKNIVYRLLQSQTGSVDVDVEFGFQSPDHVTDSGDQVAADQTAGANDAVVEEAAVAESNSMLIYIIVGVFLFISVFVGALVMYLRRSKGEKKVHPVPITVEVNKSTAAMA